MGNYQGRVTEIRLEANGRMEAFIACTEAAVPRTGQYLLSSDPVDATEALGTPLFLSQLAAHGFWAAPPVPAAWKPGTILDLIGPLGHGFNLPEAIQRLALVCLGDTVARLMPLVRQFASSHCAMTLFSDLPLPLAPSSLEAYPIASLAEAVGWADFLVFDIPLSRLPGLRDVLSLPNGSGLPWPAQALITTAMPCAGMAQCGVCAVPTQRGRKLACEDGPVFDLRSLKW